MKMEIVNKALQGGLHIWRVHDQVTNKPQGGEAALLPDQQPEMAAACPGHTYCQQTAPGGIGNQVVRVVKQIGIKSCLGQHISRLHAQALEDLGNRARTADTYNTVLG